jgi:hypothetical protein
LRFNHSLAGAVLDCEFYEIRRQFLYKAAMRDGRILIADRFYPSMRICSRDAFTGPKGRECRLSGGFAAKAVLSTSVMQTPANQHAGTWRLYVCASIPASTMDEPRTETMHTCAHI